MGTFTGEETTHQLKLDIEKVYSQLREVLDDRKKALNDLKSISNLTTINETAKEERFEGALEEIDASLENEAYFILEVVFPAFEKLNMFTVQEKVIPELKMAGLNQIALPFEGMVGEFNALNSMKETIVEQYRAVASNIATIRNNIEDISVQAIAQIEYQITHVLRSQPVIQSLNRIRGNAKQLAFYLSQMDTRRGLREYFVPSKDEKGNKIPKAGWIAPILLNILKYLGITAAILSVFGIPIPFVPFGQFLLQLPLWMRIMAATASLFGLSYAYRRQYKFFKKMNTDYDNLKRTLSYLENNDYVVKG